MVLVIDNYDSFVYNLVQYLGEFGQDIKVVRNDKIRIFEIEQLAPTHILISPGPCTPTEAGVSLDVIKHFKGAVPMLGVCLGHQAIGQAFGGQVIRAQRPVHGKVSTMYHDNQGIFAGIMNPFKATRYHSLLLEKESLPSCLEITAQTEEGEIMGVRHREFPIEGVQFHPESILTEHGHVMMKNFLNMRGRNH